MKTAQSSLWDRYRKYLCVDPTLAISVDVSRVRFPDGYVMNVSPAMTSGLDAMAALEAGAIANRDENRMVGHYWLRTPHLAPTPETGSAIRRSIADILAFAKNIHNGTLRAGVAPFKHVIHVGIGGSSLGAQLICEVLRAKDNPLTVHFLDNADPDSIRYLVESLDGALNETLVSVVSKSGATPTPKYVVQELEEIFERNIGSKDLLMTSGILMAHPHTLRRCSSATLARSPSCFEI
jgi:glucose-6-phosphate isomerase